MNDSPTRSFLLRLPIALVLLAVAIAFTLTAAGNALGGRHIENARIALSRGDAAQTQQNLEEGLRAFPDHPQGLATLGRLLIAMRRYSEAEAPLRQAAQTSAYPADSLRILGQLLTAESQTEAEGLGLLQRAVKMAPMRREEIASTWFQLGRVAMNQPDWALALWAFRHSEEAGAAGSNPYLAEGHMHSLKNLGMQEASQAATKNPGLKAEE